MQISELLSLEQVFVNYLPASKKKILEFISQQITNKLKNKKLNSQDLLTAYLERERLGVTAVGNGVAIPHIRYSEIKDPIGVFIKLEQGINFDALDKKPVDLIFALAVPSNANEECLELLGQLAGIFADKEVCDKLRHSKDKLSIYHIVVNRQEMLECA